MQSGSVDIVIVAAGRGERAGSPSEGPKQYRPIGGLPVISHTLRRFASWPKARRIVAVIHPDDVELFHHALRQAELSVTVETCFGGATRQQSVLAGLEHLAADAAGPVFIHDAVRPFFSHDLLDRAAAKLAAGVPAILAALPVADTLKRAGSQLNVTGTVPRDHLFAAQTPQGFRFPLILEAHRKAAVSGRADFTDDAAIAEWAGHTVLIVQGEPDNIKLTLRKDLEVADQRLKTLLPDVRTGNGYDVHQLEPGDGVTLCGIFIAHDQRLKGHSDADVALHALTDALLATCGAGDIGDHFPPSDPQWKGAPSRIFLEHAANIVRSRGGTIMNADISLIAEAPRIGPHREEMRANLASMLQISLDRCSVKATTNEKIGFVGRREGIAAIATATVVFGG